MSRTFFNVGEVNKMLTSARIECDDCRVRLRDEHNATSVRKAKQPNMGLWNQLVDEYTEAVKLLTKLEMAKEQAEN